MIIRVLVVALNVLLFFARVELAVRWRLGLVFFAVGLRLRRFVPPEVAHDLFFWVLRFMFPAWLEPLRKMLG